MLLLGLILTAATVLAGDNSRNHNRIIGGYQTNIKEHPYQISEIIAKKLIGSASFAMTVAKVIRKEIHQKRHLPIKLASFKNPIDFNVRVGSSYRTHDGFVHEAGKGIAFPGFSMKTFDRDVGLYILKTPIVFGETVRPIQLALEDQRPEHGEILTATGWGLTSLGPYEKRASTVLRAVQLPAVKLELCQMAYKKCSVKVTDNMICAGGLRGKLIFKGDSGGPLVNARNELVGIASWGRGVNPTGFPSIFTNVASPIVREFIAGVMNGSIS